MKKLAGDFLGGSNGDEGGDDNDGGGDDDGDGGDDDGDHHESEENESEEEDELGAGCAKNDRVSTSKSTSPSPSQSTSAVSQDTEKINKQAYLLVISENENSSELMLRIADKPEKSDYEVHEMTYIAYQIDEPATFSNSSAASVTGILEEFSPNLVPLCKKRVLCYPVRVKSSLCLAR